jgi:hypothetical protein
MPDQAEGLRQKRKPTRVISVLATPGLQSQAIYSTFALTRAWHKLDASPLLIDSDGECLEILLGCRPLHSHQPGSSRQLTESLLTQGGKTAILAKAVRAGDGEVVKEAVASGYSALLFTGGLVCDREIPLDEHTSQDIFLAASEADIETVYAFLKTLVLADSPARLWLPWNERGQAARRLYELSITKLDCMPFFADVDALSYSGHVFSRDSLSKSFQDNDFLGIVTRMISKRSVWAEETPTRTKRHA